MVGFTLGFTQEPHRPPAGGGPSTDPKMGVHIPLIVSLRGKKSVEIYSDLIESMQMGRGKEKLREKTNVFYELINTFTFQEEEEMMNLS